MSKITQLDRVLERHPDLRRASDAYDFLADGEATLSKKLFVLTSLLVS